MEAEIYQMIYIRKINETLFKLEYDEPKLYDEIKSGNIRILGHDFVENNKNKNILIINNKKNKLKEFINDREFKGDEIKIKMILIKELYDIAHMFEYCLNLKEIYFYNNITSIPDEEYQEFKESNDYSSDFYEDNNDYNIYDNCRNDDSKPNLTGIKRNEEDEYYSKVIIIIFLIKIKIIYK